MRLAQDFDVGARGAYELEQIIQYSLTPAYTTVENPRFRQRYNARHSHLTGDLVDVMEHCEISTVDVGNVTCPRVRKGPQRPNVD